VLCVVPQALLLCHAWCCRYSHCVTVAIVTVCEVVVVVVVVVLHIVVVAVITPHAVSWS